MERETIFPREPAAAAEPATGTVHLLAGTVGTRYHLGYSREAIALLITVL